jgi:hypothetical protein
MPAFFLLKGVILKLFEFINVVSKGKMGEIRRENRRFTCLTVA